MLEKTLNRIMAGAKTPEGKVIAILLTISLALMTWNATSIRAAVADEPNQTTELASQASDQSADQAATPAPQAEPAPVAQEPQAQEPAQPEVVAEQPAAEDTTNIVASEGAADPSGNEGASQAAATADDQKSGESANAEDKDAEDKEKEDAEKKEKEEEVEYPAVTFDTRYANGVRVNVSAPDGAFPEGTELIVTPVAAAAYVMTRAMGGNDRAAANIIGITTVLSMVCAPLWITLMRWGGWM